MNISTRFNAFYHSAVLIELFKKANTLKFNGWIDTETGKILTFVRGENYSEMDELKQILKNMNLDYELDEDKKISTAKIDNKSLIQHIEWCIALAADNAIEFSFVTAEWEKILYECGISR